MMRRRAMRRGGRGVVGAVARTAVVAGTAAVTVGAVQGHQQKKAYEQQAEAQAEQDAIDQQAQVQQMQAQMDAMQAQQAVPAPVAVASAAAAPDIMAQLEQLAQMKNAGILNDAEFAAAKAKLLGA